MSESNCDDLNVPKAQPIVKLKLFKKVFAKLFAKKCMEQKCLNLRGLDIVSLSTVLSGNPRLDSPGRRTGMDGQKG